MKTKDERARFTLRIPKQKLERLEAIAKEEGVSVNALILEILRNWSSDLFATEPTDDVA